MNFRSNCNSAKNFNEESDKNSFIGKGQENFSIFCGGFVGDEKKMGNIKENINEEIIGNEKKVIKKEVSAKFGASGGFVLGNVSSNQIREKAGTPGMRKKDDKKKWLKRI